MQLNDVDQVTVRVVQLDESLPLPSYSHPSDAGVDLYSSDDVVLEPGERALVGTGIACAIPDGYVGLVHPRSGLAARCGVTVLNAPGTVDAGYRGQICVNLINTDTRQAVRIARGDRIAQLLVQKVARVVFDQVTSLPESVRGAGGHGSTGGFSASRMNESREALN